MLMNHHSDLVQLFLPLSRESGNRSSHAVSFSCEANARIRVLCGEAAGHQQATATTRLERGRLLCQMGWVSFISFYLARENSATTLLETRVVFLSPNNINHKLTWQHDTTTSIILRMRFWRFKYYYYYFYVIEQNENCNFLFPSFQYLEKYTSFYINIWTYMCVL